jgi:hypothetical protein
VMALLPFGLGGVPWQCYPGHAPCPVQTDVTGRHQWSDGWYDSSDTRRETRQQMRRHLRLALSSRFPADVLSRPNLLVAAMAGITGSSRFSHLWTAARKLMTARGLGAELG